MPFKTKRHKLAAAGRHNISYSTTVRTEYKGQTQESVTSGKSNKEIYQSIEADYTFVKSELIKILVLAALIIGLQIALKIGNAPFLS